MIYDKLENLLQYLPKEYETPIKNFIASIAPDMEEGYYPIIGDKIFARVMSYPTKKRDNCKIEAHNRYVDIQSTLSGAEGIDVFSRDELSVSEEYSEKDDVVFFSSEKAQVHSTTVNYPGYFTMLSPKEAHRPQEHIDGIDNVKKFVIKMEVKDFEK